MTIKEAQGWYDAPNVRGSFDIVWGCLLVVTTAVWTVLHLNLPAKTDSPWRITFRHLRWAVYAVMAPDMVTGHAAAQWNHACQSVKEMHDLGFEQWSLEHAFYADSGGFFLDAPDIRPFPVSSASIQYLLVKKHIEYPTITTAEIWDKSKADKFAKGAAMLQSGYLVITSIARVAQRLSIPPLEVFTLSFVVSTSMSYFFWLRKPQHVGTPTYIKLSCSMASVLRDAGEKAAKPYQQTPMDFIEKESKFWVRRPITESFDLHERPLTRMPDDHILPGEWGMLSATLVGVPSLLHSTIHLLGWSFQYPTSIEAWGWRISSVALPILSIFGVGLVSHLKKTSHRKKLSLNWAWVGSGGDGINWSCLDLIVSLITLGLVLARGFILCEAIASLRLLPSDCYETVNWSQFLPHIV